jgi:hypothetical protein
MMKGAASLYAGLEGFKRFRVPAGQSPRFPGPQFAARARGPKMETIQERPPALRASLLRGRYGSDVEYLVLDSDFLTLISASARFDPHCCSF